MAKHLSDEVLLAATRGDEDANARRHLAGCAACRERVGESREGLELACLASDVPEPSPLYWEAFRLQVGERIGAERAASWPARFWRRFGLASLVPAAATAALLIAVFPVLRGNVETAPSPAPALPAWEALPPSGDDGALDVLRGLALEGTGLQAATECGSVVECMGEMNDEESQDVAEALRGQWPEGRS